MQMKAKFSIRYKFLAATTLLLVVCVGAYLTLAIREFKSDKRSLVFDYNQSIVVNTASDLENFFTALSDKMRLFALVHREKESKRNLWIGDIIRDKRDLVFIAGSKRFTEIDQIYYEDKDFLKTYGFSDNYLKEELLVRRPVPLKKIQLEGEVIWNATLKDGAPLIGYGKSVIEEDESGVPINQFAVIGFIKADRLLKTLSQGRPNEVYVATREGEIIAHLNPRMMFSTENPKDPLVELAAKSEVKKKVTEYVEGSSRYLAAYAQAFGGRVLVLSKISEARAFHAVNKLVYNSLLFSSMILTLAFLVAIFFSRSLTRPLDILMKGMGRVSGGDLTGDIQVQSKDEIASLANSFNKMIHDLKASREELEKINIDLENKVRDRTLQLESQNRAVKEVQEALLRTTRLAAVGEVAGQAAHEVLNPLTSIISRLNKIKERITKDRSHEMQVLLDINKGWSQDYLEGGFQKLLKSWQTPSKINAGASLWDEDLENIKNVSKSTLDEFKNLSVDTEFLLQEAERIVRIISNFRSLSTYRGEPKKLSLHQVCQKSMQIMADLANRDHITLKSEWRAEHDIVLIDEDEFIQVMTNLLRNAFQSVRLKHKDSKLGLVRVESLTVDDKIEVHIVDNGQGIASQHRDRLFEKNFTTKAKAEGTGIGLSISRRLIRAFKGDLTVQEQEGGAHFVISIPLERQSETDVEKCFETKRGVA